MSPPTKRDGAPAQRPVSEDSSRHQATGQRDDSAADRQDAAEDFDLLPPFPYGVDHLAADQWLDRDGQVHSGDGPYLNRPLRRLRRALGRWFR